MAQQETTFTLKAKKMFKAPIGGPLPEMINPGDVFQTKDKYLAGSLVNQEKAELTDEKPRINKDYKPPVRLDAPSDPIALLAKAVDGLSKLVSELTSRKGKDH